MPMTFVEFYSEVVVHASLSEFAWMQIIAF